MEVRTPNRQPSLHDLLVAVRAPTQVWCAQDGQIRADGAQGVYHADVRVLSSAVLTVGGAEPERLVAASLDGGVVVAVGLARGLDGPGVDPSFRVDRRRQVVVGGVDEQVRLHNSGPDPITTTVQLSLTADLLAMQHVKSGRLGELVAPDPDTEGLRWSGPSTVVEVAGDGATLESADPVRPVLSWSVRLAPGQSVELSWALRVVGSTAVVMPPDERVPPWTIPDVQADDRRLAPLVAASMDDLAGLRMAEAGRPTSEFLAAGAPWYLTLFGRDSLWAARMLLPLGTDLAATTLRTLAARQGTAVVTSTGEEPGKILHELRRAAFDLAGGRDGIGAVSLPPVYYGTIDATPLWIMLLHDAWCWGLDEAEVAALLPNLEAALTWLADHGDADGDGLLEYVDATGRGLANQGWKDSHDSVRWRDGRLATAPIALAEVQAYAYESATGGARLLDAFGRPGGQRWRDWAAALATRFREAFWVEDATGRYPAIALDADKRAVDGLTSNVAHLLGTGLLDADESAAVAARLADPTMSSGYGLRTMSSDHSAYSSLSYHCGSVWAHDTAIAVTGLARAGHHAEAGQLAEALVTAGAAFGTGLPELYGGDARSDSPLQPVPYPASCRPQAWSAAAPIALLTAALGLQADVPAGTLRLAPISPSPFGAVRVSGLRVAGHDLVAAVDAAGAVVEVSDVPGLVVDVPGLAETGGS